MKKLWPWVLLVLTTLVAYFSALNGALLWDDNMHVTRPELQSLHGLWRIWFDLGATQQYYPLLHSAFWFEHVLWGDAVLGYHLVNVLFHAASACLLVVILRRLAVPGAWIAGFAFALHPVCVEAVAWISEQKSTMSGFFYLASALTYLNRKRSWALGFFVLALMSKSVTATLPAALLIVFWWQRGRLDWRREVLPLIPWFAIGAASGLFTAWVESNARFIGAQGSQYSLTMLQRLLLAGRVAWFYAWKDVLPVNLMFTYPHWTIDAANPLQYVPLIGLVAVGAVLIWFARKNRGPLACYLFFLGTVFPALGFLNVYPFRYSYVADHFQYLALLGIIVPAAALLSRVRVGPVLLVGLGAGTCLQARNYADYETLFRATLAHNTGSSFVHSNLGVILMSTGRESEAAGEFQEAVRLTPDDPDYRVNYGLALAQIPGRREDAVAQYQAALKIAPHLSAAHLNLGLAYASMPGHLQDAIAEDQKAITEFKSTVQGEPEMWQAHLNLGIAYSLIPGREEDAIREYRAALQLKPDSAAAHFQLGNALHKLNKLPEAIEEYRASIGIDPEVAEVHYELAYALAQIPGHVPEAMAECQRMLMLKPGDRAGNELMASLVAFQQQGR